MRTTVRNTKDFAAGLFFAAAGASAFFLSNSLALGTLRMMGPGFFPVVLSAVLVLLGAILVVRSFAGKADRIAPFDPRPLLLIFAGVVAFGLLVRPAGLVLAIAPMVFLGSLAGRDFGYRSAILLALVLAAGCAIVFVYLLGQPIPLLGSWFAG